MLVMPCGSVVTSHDYSCAAAAAAAAVLCALWRLNTSTFDIFKPEICGLQSAVTGRGGVYSNAPQHGGFRKQSSKRLLFSLPHFCIIDCRTTIFLLPLQSAMSSYSAHPKLSCHISKTLKIVVESLSGDLSELRKYATELLNYPACNSRITFVCFRLAQSQDSTISSISTFGEVPFSNLQMSLDL